MRLEIQFLMKQEQGQQGPEPGRGKTGKDGRGPVANDYCNRPTRFFKKIPVACSICSNAN